MVIAVITSMTLPNQILLSSGLNCCPEHQLDRRLRAFAVAPHELVHFFRNNGLDVTAADEGLAHPRRIDVELYPGTASGEDVALEAGGNVERESVEAGIHPRVHFGRCDRYRRQEIGRVEGVTDAAGQRGLVLVDDGDGRLVQGFRHGGRGGVNVDREREGDQQHQDGVAQEAVQFLESEVEDVARRTHG
jgi:hypothetical protein